MNINFFRIAMPVCPVRPTGRGAGLFFVSCALLLGLLSNEAWALSDDLLQLKFRESTPINNSAVVRPLVTCAVQVASVKDVRRNKDSLGAVLFPSGENGTLGPIHAASLRGPGDATAWLQDALNSMQRFGIDSRGGQTSPATLSMPSLDVSLISANAWSAGINLVGHVTLAVRPSAADQPPRFVHGFSDAANWANGDGEFVGVLNGALDNAMQTWAADLLAQCKAR
ncbi:MAG: hypothetical protein Q7T87_14165 [Polaromonas sp.]|nr:hypothetical protein [Polaromonas sp.]